MCALKSERNSNIEVLRIVAMFLIVLSHCSVHGGFPSRESNFALNNYFLDWMKLGNLGVDIFVIISGYFLCTKEFKIQPLIKLLSQVWFFSYICYFIYLLSGNHYKIIDFPSVVFPTIFNEYWFFTTYVCLMLFSPFINVFIKHASNAKLLACVLIMVILLSVVPVFEPDVYKKTELPQFILLYLIGSYLRKKPKNILSNSKNRILFLLCSSLFLFSSSAILRYLSTNIVKTSIKTTILYSRTSIVVLLLASCLVSIAINRKKWTNKIVNIISSCTFGVYLLHDNPYIRKIIWSNWLKNDVYFDSDFFILKMLISVVVVYMTSTIIEYLRQLIFAHPMEVVINELYCKLQKYINIIKNKVANQ